jgi:dTDP-4-amino-4,6-dideoxygalactose transaminase
MTRDELYQKLKDKGVLSRRYFYPLISSFDTYSGLESANPSNLPVANHVADSVLCLPMHHELSEQDMDKILSLLK